MLWHDRPSCSVDRADVEVSFAASPVKVARDIGYMGLSNVLLSLSGLFSLPFLSRNLPVRDYGIWLQVVTTLSIMPALTTFGLPYALVRFLASERDKNAVQDGFYSVVLVVLVSNVAIACCAILLKPLFALALFGRQEVIVELIGLLLPVEALWTVCVGMLRAFQKVALLSSLNVARTYGEIGLTICALSQNKGLSGAVQACATVRFSLLLVLLVYLVRRIGLSWPKFGCLKAYLAFGLPTVPANISSWIVNAGDRYVLGLFLGPAAIAHYSPGYSVGSVVSIYAHVLGMVLPAILSELYDHGKVELVRGYLKYSLRYFLALAIPSAFGVSVLGNKLLLILTTPEIAASGSFVVPLVATATVLHGVGIAVSQVLVVFKDTRTIGAGWLVAAAINLVLNIILVPRIGLLAAAFTTLLSFLLCLVWFLSYSFRYLPFPFDWAFVSRSVIASLAMSVVLYVLDASGFLEVAGAIVVGAAVYAVVLLVLKAFDRSEFIMFQQLIRSRKSRVESVDVLKLGKDAS